MLNMKYCRTENVIAALREWEDDPGTDEHLHHELYELCSRITADAGLVPDMTANAEFSGAAQLHRAASAGTPS